MSTGLGGLGIPTAVTGVVSAREWLRPELSDRWRSLLDFAAGESATDTSEMRSVSTDHQSDPLSGHF